MARAASQPPSRSFQLSTADNATSLRGALRSEKRRERNGLATLVMPDKEERATLFRRIDYNSNGVLSLAQIVGAVAVLWPHLHDKQVVVSLAFYAADVDKSGLIGRKEFRLLLEHVLYFNSLWDRFESIGAEHEPESRLTVSEFKKGCGVVGIRIGDTDASEAYDIMDAGGVLRFSEFCGWCARRAAVANGFGIKKGGQKAGHNRETIPAAAAAAGEKKFGKYREETYRKRAVSSATNSNDRKKRGNNRNIAAAGGGMALGDTSAATSHVAAVADGLSMMSEEDTAFAKRAERLAAAAMSGDVSPSSLVEEYLKAQAPPPAQGPASKELLRLEQVRFPAVFRPFSGRFPPDFG